MSFSTFLRENVEVMISSMSSILAEIVVWHISYVVSEMLKTIIRNKTKIFATVNYVFYKKICYTHLCCNIEMCFIIIIFKIKSSSM